MTYSALRKECDRDGIGLLFWELLVAVTGRTARRYPPEVYADGAQWSAEAIDDLAQQVALDRLLAENQLAYVLDLATDEDSLARLLSFQVRRVLSHRRAVSVVDRLLARVRTIAGTDGYALEPFGADEWITATGEHATPSVMRGDQVAEAVRLIASIPRLPSNPTASRESKVYGAGELADLLGRLVSTFGGITMGDLRRILENVLTAWLPTLLQDNEEDQISDSSPELELQRSVMKGLVNDVARSIDTVLRTVLIGKSQGVSDGDLAARLGRSRPWVADRKSEVLAHVEQSLMSQLPAILHSEAAQLLLEELAMLEDA
mgnify:CR=1 FL=1